MASQSSLDIILESGEEGTHHINHSHGHSDNDNYRAGDGVDDDVPDGIMDVDGGSVLNRIGKNREEYEEISNMEPDTGKAFNSKSSQSWRNVRAVMAYYCSLRKIKRHDGNIFV